jgi:uncharacterized membrane protein
MIAPMLVANGVVLRCGALLLVTVSVVVSYALGWNSPIRHALAFAFLLFVPGLALAELVGITEALHRFALATGTSLALETLVAISLLYAGAFSVALVLAITAGLTVVALAFTVAAQVREAGS